MSGKARKRLVKKGSGKNKKIIIRKKVRKSPRHV